MNVVGQVLSWIGFLYLTLVSLSALYLLARLNLSLLQTLIYFLLVAIIVGIPYGLLGLLNKLTTGSCKWLPWRWLMTALTEQHDQRDGNGHAGNKAH